MDNQIEEKLFLAPKENFHWMSTQDKSEEGYSHHRQPNDTPFLRMMLDKVIMHDMEETRSIFSGAEINPHVPPVSPP